MSEQPQMQPASSAEHFYDGASVTEMQARIAELEAENGQLRKAQDSLGKERNTWSRQISDVRDELGMDFSRDVLRRAADMLDEAASKDTPGRWIARITMVDPTLGKALAEWLRIVHSGHVPDSTTNTLCVTCEDRYPCADAAYAFDVASAILREEGES